MSFGSIIRDATGQGSLLRIVEEQFVRSEKKQPLEPSRDFIRASSVHNLCPREEVFCALKNIVRPDEIDAGLNLTFLHGTALHWGLQNKLLGPLGVLYGTWKCESCGEVYGKQTAPRPESWAVPMPKACKCGHKEFNYIEAAFKDEALRMTGHCDGFLVLPGLAGMGILEAKSIGAKGAREIQNAPKVEHLIQAHVYMMFSGLRWAKILYWQKSEAGIKSLLEHHVERDEETINHIRDMVQSIWTGIELGAPPKDRICANATCPRAKACFATSYCFAET